MRLVELGCTARHFLRASAPPREMISAFSFPNFCFYLPGTALPAVLGTARSAGFLAAGAAASAKSVGSTQLRFGRSFAPPRFRGVNSSLSPDLAVCLLA